MEKSNPLIRLRDANETDIDFIFNSWLKSFRDSAFALKIQSPIYFAEQHKVIERLVKHSRVVIACNDSDPSQIFGWICADILQGIFCLHYVYVKHSFRRLGIGKVLLNAFEHEGAGVYTHKTRAMDAFGEKFNLVYHPYILLNKYIPRLEEQE
jgi:GNAT superfamily N-acetyltransferase